MIIAVYILVALFGLSLGSFLNVVIYRLPKGYSIVSPRSFCPNCRRQLPWYENIPVFSYIFLKGRCRGCGAKISIQYPLIELLGALTAIGVFAVYDISIDAFFVFLFLMALIAVTLIDWRYRIIPDQISLPFILLGIGWSLLSPARSPSSAALGALLGGGGLFLIGYLYKLIRHVDGMGGGDVKLMAMIGAFLGVRMLLPVILIASLTGSVYGIYLMRKGGDAKSMVAFGSFLAPAAAICLFFGEQFLRYYFARF